MRSPRLALLLLLCGCAFSPDEDLRNGALVGAKPELPADAIETVVELPRPPGNLAVGPDGRVYFTFHPEAAPKEIKVAELLPDGTVAPYPDAAWQRERDSGPWWVTPLAMRTDELGRLWVLDHGDYGSEAPSLTAFDLATRRLVHRVVFAADVAGWGSMLNDLVVDARRGFVYIAETSAFDFDPALIVYDIERKSARRVLEDHPSVDYEDQHCVVQGRFMTYLGIPLRIAVDTIALSPDGEWLYYGPLTGSTLWRLPTAALRDPAQDDAALARKVEAYCEKPITDGAIMGPDGSLYLTAIELDGIAVVRPGRPLSLLAQDPEKLAWPDGLAMSPDGSWLYVTASELHHVIGEDLDDLPRFRPYRILRLRVQLPEARTGPPQVERPAGE
jgi:sugar lactone lactonase YvrE